MTLTFIWSVYKIQSDKDSWLKTLAIIGLFVSGPYLLALLLK
jgi:hypothetical protein